MAARKVKGAVPQLDAAILREAKYFTIVLNDGQELMCKLLELGHYDLHIEVETGELLMSKHSVKCYVVDGYDAETPYKPPEDQKKQPTRLKLNEITVPESFQKAPPRRKKCRPELNTTESTAASTSR